MHVYKLHKNKERRSVKTPGNTDLGGLQVCVVGVLYHKTTFISVIISILKIILNFSVILHDLLVWLNLQKHGTLLSRCFLLVPKQNLVGISLYPSFLLPAWLWSSSLECAAHSHRAPLDIYKMRMPAYSSFIAYTLLSLGDPWSNFLFQ